MFEIIGQLAIPREGDGTEDGELAQLHFFPEHAKHRPTLAVPFVQQSVEVAPVLDIFFRFVEQEGRLELLDDAE